MIRNGCYTIVNPKTGGNRTIRVRQMPENFSGRAGSRFVEFLGEAYPRGVTVGPDTEKELRWIGFAFVNPDQVPVIWSRFRGPEYKTQIAALRFLFGPKGQGYAPWFESNFKELYGGTPVALDPHNPNPVDAAAGIAARAMGGGDEQ